MAERRASGGSVHRRGRLLVREGDAVPAVALPSARGGVVDLAAAAATGHVVLFFYPGDREGLRYPELSGCTAQAHAFDAGAAGFARWGARVFGVSLQSPQRQRAFLDREHLELELLSDREEALTGALGVPVWVSDQGERFAVRTTVVIRRGGTVAALFPDVDVDGHVDAVAAVLASLGD